VATGFVQNSNKQSKKCFYTKKQLTNIAVISIMRPVPTKQLTASRNAI